MNEKMKRKAKLALAVAAVLCIVPQCCAAAYGGNVISDPFSCERPAYDVNVDGEFNILDLVRLKKYIAGAKVTVDMSVFAYEWKNSPITDWNIFAPNYDTVSQSLVNPVPSVAANGIRVTPKNSGTLETAVNGDIYIAGRKVYAAAQLNTPICVSEGDGIIFYLRTDAAETLLPMFPVSDPKILSYKPDMALKVGAEYFYMPPGGDWTAATATESGCSSSSAYFRLISFDKAFEGYIKIPFKSLSNDAAAVAALDGENYIERIICTVKGLGGKYGNVVFGPFFVYRDCTSADGYAAAVAAVRKALLKSK